MAAPQCSKSSSLLFTFVLVTGVLLVLLGWSGLSTTTKPPRPALPPAQPSSTSRFRDDSTAFVKVTHQTTEEASPWTKSQPPACTINEDLKVLGRVLDRCSTEEAARLAVEEDIYVSVKTTPKYHSKRMLPVLQTWFQSLPADRIHIVTDSTPPSDTLLRIARETGIDVVITDCPSAYSHAALCCKSRNEYFRYFNTTTKTGDLHKWYCHFDDDMYVNIPALVKALREALNKSKDGGVYLGRWPKENMPTMPDGMPASKETLRRLGIELEKPLTVRWATGAAYCVTSTVMKKIKELLLKNTYETYCKKFGLSDDTTAAILIGLSGCFLTNTDLVRTQYDGNRRPMVDFKQLITISYHMYSKALDNDPSKFLAYHCLLYPSTSWCG